MFGVTPAKTSYVGLYRNCFAGEIQFPSDRIQVVYAYTDNTYYPDAELSIGGGLRIPL
jgi:hypothetical protein